MLAAAITLSFAVERLIPYHDPWNSSHDDVGRDTAHVVVNEIVVLVSLSVVPLLAVLIPWSGPWPHSWPLAVQVPAAILIADLGVTLMHYASHKVGALWRFHAVHHSVKRFYGLNGLMKHPLHQTIETTAGFAPLLLAGTARRLLLRPSPPLHLRCARHGRQTRLPHRLPGPARRTLPRLGRLPRRAHRPRSRRAGADGCCGGRPGRGRQQPRQARCPQQPWLQLVREAPPAVLARTLGISPRTAMQHATRGGTDYQAYAAIRSREEHN